jgi:hypothetical protein
LAIFQVLSTTSKDWSTIVGHALEMSIIFRSLSLVSKIATNYAIVILLGVFLNSTEEELFRDIVHMGIFDKLVLFLYMECSPGKKQRDDDLLKILSSMHQNSSSNDSSILAL